MKFLSPFPGSSRSGLRTWTKWRTTRQRAPTPTLSPSTRPLRLACQLFCCIFDIFFACKHIRVFFLNIFSIEPKSQKIFFSFFIGLALFCFEIVLISKCSQQPIREPVGCVTSSAYSSSLLWLDEIFFVPSFSDWFATGEQKLLRQISCLSVMQKHSNF